MASDSRFLRLAFSSGGGGTPFVTRPAKLFPKGSLPGIQLVTEGVALKAPRIGEATK